MFAIGKYRLKNGVIYLFLGLVFVLLLSFTQSKNAERRVKMIVPIVDAEPNSYFVGREDILELLTLGGEDPIVDKKYENLDLKVLENRIENFKFVSDAQVSKDLKGVLTVKVTQRKPVARLLTSKGVDFYISRDAVTLEVSNKYTARVLVVSGKYVDKLVDSTFLNSTDGRLYLNLFKRIDQSEFWKAQIAQIDIGLDGDITMYPQVGNQTIKFGKPVDIEDKFIRLGLFYKKIIPVKGWNHYKTVNLKFKDQIICD